MNQLYNYEVWSLNKIRGDQILKMRSDNLESATKKYNQLKEDKLDPRLYQTYVGRIKMVIK